MSAAWDALVEQADAAMALLPRLMELAARAAAGQMPGIAVEVSTRTGSLPRLDCVGLELRSEWESHGLRPDEQAEDLRRAGFLHYPGGFVVAAKDWHRALAEALTGGAP